ncbi:uncharacterized protein PG998_004899 [Apiospora kogelbergensis]|uniref:Uncharacterized protein n=1 Tax=Apiospora kogelbergensis TaxID=1337665 RepID=A0AAW0Q9J1_9PEZI
MSDVATIRQNLGRDTIGAGNASAVRDYLLNNAETVHMLRARVWLSTLRADPLWGLNNQAKEKPIIQAWHRRTNVTVHDLDFAGDCLVAQAGEIGM